MFSQSAVFGIPAQANSSDLGTVADDVAPRGDIVEHFLPFHFRTPLQKWVRRIQFPQLGITEFLLAGGLVDHRLGVVARIETAGGAVHDAAVRIRLILLRFVLGHSEVALVAPAFGLPSPPPRGRKSSSSLRPGA